jgi:predicted dehydrogenase
MKIGIAVLGAGRWGVHLIRNFLEHPQARVVAVVDPHPERLAQVRERFELDGDVMLAQDWETIRKKEDIAAVAIATPAATHYPLIADALRQGHHVLAEKPLTLDPAECLELCRLAEQQSRQLMVDHTYLFHPAVERAAQVVQSGRLGALRYGYGTRTHLGPVRQDVDALWDLAIHDIAIFNTLLGQTPVQVQATGTVWLQQNPSLIASSGQGLADLVWATLTYPNGVCASIHLCWLNPDKQRRLCVVGDRGTLIFDELLTDAPLTVQQGHFEQTDDSFTPAGLAREVVGIEPGEPLGRVCDRFLTSIIEATPSPVSSGWVGAQLVQILHCLSQSLHQGGVPVTVPPLRIGQDK